MTDIHARYGEVVARALRNAVIREYLEKNG